MPAKKTANPAIPDFEEDYERADFGTANDIQFRFRGVEFTLKRLTLLEKEEISRRIGDGTIHSDSEYFEAILTEAQFKRFMELANDPDNPPLPDTVRNIVRYIQDQKSGAGDPK